MNNKAIFEKSKKWNESDKKHKSFDIKSAMTFCTMIFRITELSITGTIVTLSIEDISHVMLRVTLALQSGFALN